jgi:predicted AAA+ superfamily ATPase
MIPRDLIIPERQSFFLFGPRQTGKSTFVKANLGPDDLLINLLPQRSFLNYSRDPGRLHAEVTAHARKLNKQFRVVIDEVQKAPGLLDDVHDLMETFPIQFILTGSSARKLKRGAANLLAGRAVTRRMFPLTVSELGGRLDLERALLYGTLPLAWNQISHEEETRDQLRAYAETYLREEIQQEALVRNIGAFARFLDIAAASDTQIINYSTIARDCAVSSKTVQEYYNILEETFLAYRVEPWATSARKRLVSHPKFFFFDVGVTNAMASTFGETLSPAVRGQRFESFFLGQILAKIAHLQSDLRVYFWRTHTGSEVDFILVNQDRPVAALEIKAREHLHPADTAGLRSFLNDYPTVPCFVIGTGGNAREISDSIRYGAWNDFLLQELPKLGVNSGS